MNKRHKILMTAWTAALLVAAVLFWDRLFPRGTVPVGPGKADNVSVAADTAPAQAGRGPSAPSQAQLQQALKARNPGYNGRGQFAEQGGKIVLIDLSGAGLTDLTPLKGLSLEALDISRNPVSDLSPLKGMPLRKLGLEGTKVVDLAPLGGMPLTDLYMNNTPVRDLSPLKGLPLKMLNLFETGVEDLSPLAGMALEFLWLNGTRVKDISPLKGCPLVSLTLERTPVADLSPLAGSKLERLHIGQSAVTDLTPIKGLPLTRLIFTPKQIKQGMEIARGTPSIREVGTTLDGKMQPEQFWALFDQGKLVPSP